MASRGPLCLSKLHILRPFRGGTGSLIALLLLSPLSPMGFAGAPLPEQAPYPSPVSRGTGSLIALLLLSPLSPMGFAGAPLLEQAPYPSPVSRGNGLPHCAAPPLPTKPIGLRGGPFARDAVYAPPTIFVIWPAGGQWLHPSHGCTHCSSAVRGRMGAWQLKSTPPAQGNSAAPFCDWASAISARRQITF